MESGETISCFLPLAHRFSDKQVHSDEKGPFLSITQELIAWIQSKYDIHMELQSFSVDQRLEDPVWKGVFFLSGPSSWIRSARGDVICSRIFPVFFDISSTCDP